MATRPFNATDEYATFVEDCRLGRIEYSDGRRMQFTKIEGDFAVPVFNFGTAGCVMDDRAMLAGAKLMDDGQFHLPFSECLYILYFPPEHPRTDKPTLSTVWIVHLEEHTVDGAPAITGNLYYRHPGKMANYGVNSAQFTIRPNGVEIADDPRASAGGAMGYDREQHQKVIRMSAQHRAWSVLALTLQLSRQDGGTATLEPATERAANVNRKRAMYKQLPPLPLVRRIDLAPYEPPSAGEPTGTGITQRPHWRRGTYRHLKSGKVVPVRAYAVHGGGDNPPPWYEVTGSEA